MDFSEFLYRYNSIGISIKPENKRILCELWEEVNRQSAHINSRLGNSSPTITIDWIKMANGCEKECRKECQKAYQFYFQERIRLHGGSHDTYSDRLNQINTLIKALDETLGEDHEAISNLIVTNSSLINFSEILESRKNALIAKVKEGDVSNSPLTIIDQAADLYRCPISSKRWEALESATRQLSVSIRSINPNEGIFARLIRKLAFIGRAIKKFFCLSNRLSKKI